MICPNCKTGKAKVKETRMVGTVAWRRRICDSNACEYRFSTYEMNGDEIVGAIGRAVYSSSVKGALMGAFLGLMRGIDNAIKK